jgi:hypothetical protein
VQATKTFAKVKVAIQAALAKVEGVVKGAVKIIARLSDRQRYEKRGIRLTRDSWHTTIVTQNVQKARSWQH